jgi:hypothetical protein
MVMKNNTRLTKTFIAVMTLAAIAGTAYAGLVKLESHTLNFYYALAVLALSAATSRMKVKLPGIEGNMSVNLPFLLMAVVTLSGVEAIMIASVSTMVQCWPKFGGKFKPEQMLFNVSMMAFATFTANLIAHSAWLGASNWASQPLVLAATTGAFFLGQTVPVAGIINLTQGTAMRKVWASIAQLSFPYYVLSAGMTSMLNLASQRFGWQATLLVLPVMFAIHRSYRLYFGREGETVQPTPMAKAARASV